MKGVGGSSGGGSRQQWSCNYCDEAALHCRADAARLCVACDCHVHAANVLSRKHVRASFLRAPESPGPLCADCDDDDDEGELVEGFSR
jgi:hypothetical protein